MYLIYFILIKFLLYLKIYCQESLSIVQLLGTKFHRNPLNLKKILIYIILFTKQFDNKIFELKY